jgi:hypothetical protein
MPLIRPEIQKVLRATGLEKEPTEGTISEKLSEVGLSDDSIAENLADIATRSGNEALRLRAIETALKVRGALKDQVQNSTPTFNLIIQSCNPSVTPPSVNPIVFPRQSLGLTPQSPESIQYTKDAPKGAN